MITATLGKVGRTADTSSEQYRHECEVRQVAAMPDREYRKHYLAGVRRKRGDAAVDRIKRDLWTLAGEVGVNLFLNWLLWMGWFFFGYLIGAKVLFA